MVELVFIIFALGWILDQFVVRQKSLNFKFRTPISHSGMTLY
jgi:hypothetical protein